MLNIALSLTVVFTLGEIFLLLNRRSKKDRKAHDKNTLQAFWIVLPVSICLAFQTVRLPPSETFPLSASLVPVGFLMAFSGLLLRWYAIYRLGRWFTVDVALSAEQVLMQSGPYRYVRHPSYTGALLTLAGVGILLGNIPALLLMTLPSLVMFLLRIRVEERTLAQAFGPQWTGYSTRSWCLLPWVY